MKKIKFLLYRLKWHLAPYINLKSPVHVDIELTSRCNLKCTFCHQQDRQYKLGDMSFDMAKRIIKECADIGVKSVKFNWRGESSMHDNCSGLIRYAKSVGLFVYMNTNFSRKYNDLWIMDIAEYVDVLKVSIDSVIKSRYDKIRKGANLNTTLANLMKLAVHRERYKMPPIIISRRTLDNWEPDEFFKGYFKDSKYKFKFDIRPAMPRNSKMKKQKERKRKYCGQPSRRLVVGWDGQVFPCCVAYNEPDDIFLHNIAIPGIGLKKIWEDTRFRFPKIDLSEAYVSCKNCTSKDAYK